eukprot:s1266_g11.t3
MKSGSINVCSTPAAMLAPRQFGRPSETLESETPRTGEKSGVTTLEPTCFGKSSDSSSTKSSLSPRKIGAEGPSATPAQQVSEGNEGFFPEVKDVEEGPAELAPAGAHADVPSQDAQPKGKGKGGKGKAPPPKAKPKATRTSSSVQLPKAAPASGGMSALLERVKAIGEKKDLEESKEIGDIDLSQIDPSAKRERVKCPRCEKDVLEEDMASHMTAHSSEILSWLFLGGKRNLENDQELTVRTNITHVLNLANDVNPHPDTVDFVTKYNEERGLPFRYKKLEFGDTRDQDILKELDGALQFIHDAKTGDERHRVLVNCAQGVSRSASVTIAYLMKYEAMSLRQAYDHVLERRTIADPRKEFLDQLGIFECELFGISTPTLTGEEIFAHRNLLNVDSDPLPSKAQMAEGGVLEAVEAKKRDETAEAYLQFLYSCIARQSQEASVALSRSPVYATAEVVEASPEVEPEGQLLEAADAKNRDQAASSYLRFCYSAQAQKARI